MKKVLAGIILLGTLIWVLGFVSGCGQSTSQNGGGDGGSGYTIVQVTSSNADYDPTFSPDGNHMIYDQKLSDENHELFKINLNNLSEKTSLGTCAAEASWNPVDSNKIAFVKMDKSTGMWGGEAIYTMDANGGSITKIAPTGSATAAWSTDGQYLLYEAYGSIYKVGVNGAGTTELTSYQADGHCAWPSFSYDGTKILYIKKSNSMSQGGNIWIMDTDGGNKTEFLATSEGQYLVFQQAWNKYDEIIFMHIFDAAAKKAPVVKLIKSDKTGLITLTEDNIVSGDPVWDNDGKRIGLIRGPADNSEIQNVYYLIYRN